MAASKMGRPTWSAGLTAATDPRLAGVAARLRGRIRGPYQWVRANRGDLCAVLPVPEQSHADYAYVLGMYLGDGHIAKARQSYVLRIYLDNAHPRLIERCIAAVGRVNAFHKVGTVRRESDTIVRSYGLCWLRLLPQHGPGRKHERAIVLESWQSAIVTAQPKAFLRGLIESDGCRFNRIVGGKSYPAYEFTNLSRDILGLFTWTCDMLALHYSLPSTVDVSIARRADVTRLDEFIGPKS